MKREYKDALARQIGNNFSELEGRIMSDIVRRIREAGEITSTADYQINRLRILGHSSEEIENAIKEALGASYPEMFELYDKVLDSEYVRSKEVYDQINAKYIPYSDNKEMQQVVTGLIEQTETELANITQSMGFYLDYGNGKRVMTPLSQVYTKYLDMACMDIVSGAFDYNSVLKRTVTQLTNSGLRTIDYASGAHARVDVAARRAVMTGISQLTGKIANTQAKELGTNYFEVAWHAGARPSHAEWQGKVWSERQLYDVCGLGTVTGLLGANCYHEYYPFFPGISERNWSDEWLEAKNTEESEPKEFAGKEYTAYEARQKQRQMELAMRAQRQKVRLMQEAKADPTEIMLMQAKYQAQLSEYTIFSKKMGLKQERERIYLDGQGRVGVASVSGLYPKKYSESSRQRKEIVGIQQNYRPIDRGDSAEFMYKKEANAIKAKRVSSYSDDVYISDKAKIKPRALHDIVRNTKEAMKSYGINIDTKLSIVIADIEELHSLGKYVAHSNTVYYVPGIANKEAMKQYGGLRSIEYHEMWHMKQAEDFRKLYGEITLENQPVYIKKTAIKCKARLDRLEINEYNVNKISKYANDAYLVRRYDEVEAEYMTKKEVQ